MDPHIQIDIIAYSGNGLRPVTVTAIREVPLRILIGDRELIRLLCSGMHPRFLAAGYLFGCGVITRASDIADITVHEDEAGIEARVVLRRDAAGLLGLDITSGLGRVVRTSTPRPEALSPPKAPWLRPDALLSLARELHARSDLYRLTRGCHNASLCSATAMLLFRPDIGRHNAIDTIVGQTLLEGLPVADKLIVTTGRVASEIVQKAVRAGVPVLAATAVATSLAVEEAREYGLTLVGNITNDGFWVYNDPGRLHGFSQQTHAPKL